MQSASQNYGKSDVFDRFVTVQIQEELDQLPQEATANAMNVIKSEKYVFTNNNGYMKLLNKMKEYVMRKQNRSCDEHVEAFTHSLHDFKIPKQNNSSDADARDAKDEVIRRGLPLSLSALSLTFASQACYCTCVRACWLVCILPIRPTVIQNSGTVLPPSRSDNTHGLLLMLLQHICNPCLEQHLTVSNTSNMTQLTQDSREAGNKHHSPCQKGCSNFFAGSGKPGCPGCWQWLQ